jgi:hypothetical protein
MARYFASKLWHGESYYMQIDAHSFFADVSYPPRRYSHLDQSA